MCKLVSRIQDIAIAKNITIGALERNIGASKGVLSRAINNNTDIQSKWIELIVENYPDINTSWLLTGKGSMLHTVATPEATPIPKPVAICMENSQEGIPLIPISAMAGALSGEVNVLEHECERYIIPSFKGAEFLIPVKGSSMQPKYNSGDIVACKRIPMNDLFFQWNKVYVVDTNQGALVKRLKQGSTPEHILLVSDNEKYDPFELHINQIHAVALVVGVVRLE